MKITHVHPDKCVPKEAVAFVTDPPLSDEVFEAFEEARYESTDFRHEDGVLILANFGLLNEQLKPTIEQQLTEAEETIQAKKDGARNFHNNFVKTVSQKTGIPIRPSSA